MSTGSVMRQVPLSTLFPKESSLMGTPATSENEGTNGARLCPVHRISRSVQCLRGLSPLHVQSSLTLASPFPLRLVLRTQPRPGSHPQTIRVLACLNLGPLINTNNEDRTSFSTDKTTVQSRRSGLDFSQNTLVKFNIIKQGPTGFS